MQRWPRPSPGPGGTPAGPAVCHLAGGPPPPGLGSPPSAGPGGGEGPGVKVLWIPPHTAVVSGSRGGERVGFCS